MVFLVNYLKTKSIVKLKAILYTDVPVDVKEKTLRGIIHCICPLKIKSIDLMYKL